VLQPVNPAFWAIAVTGACCYAACWYTKSGGINAFVSALFTATSIGALLVLGAHPKVGLLATARTLVICAVALACGFTGAHTGAIALLRGLRRKSRLDHTHLHGADFDEAIEIAQKHAAAKFGMIEIRPVWQT
jgi:hypothetical protein